MKSLAGIGVLLAFVVVIFLAIWGVAYVIGMLINFAAAVVSNWNRRKARNHDVR